MVHYSPPLFQSESTTPPDSPLIALSDDESNDMVTAIATMVPTTLSPYFSSSEALPRNPPPTPETSAVEHLEQLISKIIEEKLPTSAGKSEDPTPVAPGDNQPEDVVAEVSRLEFKAVNELYVSNSV
jgi:hypothetical protein